MPEFRRNRVSGGTYFFTIAIAERHKDLLVKHIALLRNAIHLEKKRAPFVIIAMSILPDHLHAVWRLPVGDTNYSERWRRIKATFSKMLKRNETVSKSRFEKGERGIWQRRFWEHTIRDDADLQRHMDYVHFNLVKHRYVKKAADWQHSTFHAYVDRGVYPVDWGSAEEEKEGAYGEPD